MLALAFKIHKKFKHKTKALGQPMNSELALCYYPTQVALIDDNTNFLTALSLHMQQKYTCCTFDDPVAGLRFANYSASKITNPLQNEELKNLAQSDFEDIVQLTFNQPGFLRDRQERYEELSVVVVDYQMPNINGLEFCRQLCNPNVKKILLTSEISDMEVIQAFNEGLIDYYVCKRNRDMVDELHQAIARLQLEYFRDMSRQIKTRALEGANAIFSDSALSSHFFKICKELEVLEYYFVTKPSRYILHTHSGKEISMLMFSSEELEKHIRIMEEEAAPSDLLAKVKSGEYLPYFSSSDGYYEPELEIWNSWLLPATRIKGKQDYYCAFYAPSANCPNHLPIANLVATFH